MNGLTSTYAVVAWVVIAAMALVGLGTLFVRAENIERRNLVGIGTLLACGAAVALMLSASGSTIETQDRTAWGCIALAIAGFFLFRVVDMMLGGRSRIHHDPATLNADLAD